MNNNGSEIDRPYIFLSTDDGLKSNLQAAEILNEFGIKNPKVKKFDEICIRREHVIFFWPKQHILYFLAKGALAADSNNDYFAY